MATEPQEYGDLKSAIAKNAKLLEENNKLLRKLYRNELWVFWLRLAWYVLILGMPFALYFYVLQPYFEALGANYDTFKAGIEEIPGLKGLGQLLEKMAE